jgi:hypothetical protein
MRHDLGQTNQQKGNVLLMEKVELSQGRKRRRKGSSEKLHPFLFRARPHQALSLP